MNLSKKAISMAVSGAVMLMTSLSSMAQVHVPHPPTGGSIMQQKKAESRHLDSLDDNEDPVDVLKAAPQPLQHYQLKHFQFVGNTQISSDELGLLVQPYVGKEVSSLQLEQIAEMISAAYHAHGHGFTSTTIDPAGLARGDVTFSIVEGKAGKVSLSNHSRVNDWLLNGPLERFQNNPDNTDNLDRASLLISDIPGVSTAAPRLSRGAADGTVDVIVDAQSTPLVSGYASIDNYGSKTSGRTRMSAMLGVNSPFGWGDALRLNISGMPFHTDGKSTLGGASYDFPLGNGGLRGGLGYNRLKYQLGGVYAGLFDGTTDVWSAYANYPIIRQQTSNLYGRLTYSHSRYQDNQLMFENRRHAESLALMFYGNHQDLLFGRNGFNRYSVTLTHGNLTYDSAVFAQQDHQGSKTAGEYTKAEVSLSRMQQLTNATYLQGEIQGQYAFKNLDGASRMVLGGPSSVRAFSSDFLSVDSGVMFKGTAGWRLPVGLPTTLYTFYDAAAGVLRHTPIHGVSNHVNLQGAGIGMDVSYRNITASVSMATRLGGNALGMQNQPKTWTWASLTYVY